jgi:hypothetical protein
MLYNTPGNFNAWWYFNLKILSCSSKPSIHLGEDIEVIRTADSVYHTMVTYVALLYRRSSTEIKSDRCQCPRMRQRRGLTVEITGEDNVSTYPLICERCDVQASALPPNVATHLFALYQHSLNKAALLYTQTCTHRRTFPHIRPAGRSQLVGPTSFDYSSTRSFSWYPTYTCTK